jgi:hypothetical protein
MARGTSGRIVAEIDPELKASLYEALARERMTLKDWLIRQAALQVAQSRQPQLFDHVKVAARAPEERRS